MAKIFSTRTHGVLDYVTMAQLFTLPRIFGWSEGAKQWTTGMALGTLANSVVTRYEYGPLKLLPMQGHLAIDFLQGLLFCAFPLLFPKESTAVKTTVVGFGLFSIFAAFATETEPSYAEQVSQLNQDLADTVQHATNSLSTREVGA